MKLFLCIIFFCPLLSKAQSWLADSMIKINSLQASVSFLANDDLQGRLTGTDAALQAAKFIAEKMDTAGLKPLPGKQNYFDSFPASNYGKKINGLNVIGFLPGNAANDSLVIFSAHYDHIGKGNDVQYNKDYRYDDEIFNGANDNATGVAALLELAKYYGAQKTNRYNILFIAFAGEELGLQGSTAYVNKIKPGLVKAVINLEMLGIPTNENCFVISLGNRQRLKNSLNTSLTTRLSSAEKNFFVTDPYIDDNLSYRSDHYPFARKIKNAFTIMATSPTDEFYHTVDDEYETIDFYFLLKATRNIALACESFIR